MTQKLKLAMLGSNSSDGFNVQLSTATRVLSLSNATHIPCSFLSGPRLSGLI